MPEDVRLRFKAIPLQFEGNVLVVAFSEPPSAHDVDTLASRIGHRVNPVLADPVLIAHLVGEVAGSIPGPAPDSPLADHSPEENHDSAPDRQTVESLLQTGIPASVTDGSIPLHVDDLLRYAVTVGASDLHLTASMPGTIRLHGAIRPIEGCPPLDHETIREMIFGILPASQRERFEAEHELDTSHSIAGVGRFRVNVFGPTRDDRCCAASDSPRDARIRYPRPS